MITNSEVVQTRKDVPSGSIIINRPSRRNALSRDVVRQIRQALEDLHQERKVRAVILTGTGEVFSSGSDLHELKETIDDENMLAQWHSDVSEFQSLLEEMLRFPKPIICAVNGWVIGSAVALMLGSDYVIASENSKLVLPEGRLGLSSSMSAPLLVHRVGVNTANRLMMTAETIDSKTATNLGLYQESVPDSLVWVRSQELAKQVGELSHESILMNKQMLNETIGEQIFTQLSIGAANVATARTTEVAAEGIAAFLEKRTPSW